MKIFRLIFVLLAVQAYAVSPTIVAHLTDTGLLANLSATTVYTPPTTGLFRISTQLECVHNGVCSGSIVEYDYTDEFGSQFAQVTNGNTPVNSFAVITIHAVAGDPITVSTQTHPDGVNAYNLYVVVERIGD